MIKRTPESIPLPELQDIAGGCIVLGGGGHARMVIECLRMDLPASRCLVLDNDAALWGTYISSVRVVGGDELLPELVRRGATHFVVGLGSVGDNRQRERLFLLGKSSKLQPLAVAHPSAVCAPSAELGPGSQVLPGSIINPGARIMENVIVNSGAVVEHDCVVGPHSHIASGALLAGGVQIDACVHIGAGAIVLQTVKVGKGAIVGAGTVVSRDVAAHTTVVGVPARVIKR